MSDDLSPGWDNGDNWATCLPLEGLSLVYMEVDTGVPRAAISNLQSPFRTSDSVTFALVSVAEASDVAQPRVSVEGTTQEYGYGEKIVTIVQTIPFRA